MNRPEALLQPIRIVRNMQRLGPLGAGDPYEHLECLQSIYAIDGRPLPVTTGTLIEQPVLDLFNRPWAQLWERYFEQDMQRPEAADIFSFDQQEP